MDNNEVKSAVETLGKTFESFKETNDERLKQIEAKGSSDPITENKLSKIEADLDKVADMEKNMKAQSEYQKASQEQMARLETIISRPDFGKGSPVESKARILLARSVAPTVNSVEVIVFVLDNFIDLSASSDTCCATIVARSKPSSCVSAGNGSLAI